MHAPDARIRSLRQLAIGCTEDRGRHELFRRLGGLTPGLVRGARPASLFVPIIPDDGFWATYRATGLAG